MTVAARAPSVVALSGGVGGAKLARGLARVLPAGDLCVIANTGDDFTHLGLTIAPDFDSILYAIAGLSDAQRGWGRAAETWHALETLRNLGGPDWFALGDRDLGLHLWRSERLRGGATLGAVARELATAFGLKQHLLPMSNAPVRTRLRTSEGLLDFQHYFVRRRCEPVVLGIEFEGAATAAVCEDLATLMGGGRAQAIVLCPSNPYLSIDPILAVPGWRDWLREQACPIVAVSPIVGGEVLKGCAAKLMREFNQPVAATTIARHYAGLIDVLCIDSRDAALAPQIEALGMRCMVTQTVMTDDASREALARQVLVAAAT